MSIAAQTIRSSRLKAKLTQADLARRLGTSQAAVAQLERLGSNPRIATLERALHATGHRLEIIGRPHRSSIDESLIARQLELTPAQRLIAFQAVYDGVREVALAGARSRGELA